MSKKVHSGHGCEFLIVGRVLVGGICCTENTDFWSNTQVPFRMGLIK